MNNRANTRWVIVDGQRLPLAEASRKYGINYSTARWRLNAGMDGDAVFKEGRA